MTFEPRGSVEQRGGARSPSCSVALRPVAVLERCERQIRSGEIAQRAVRPSIIVIVLSTRSARLGPGRAR